MPERSISRPSQPRPRFDFALGALFFAARHAIGKLVSPSEAVRQERKAEKEVNSGWQRRKTEQHTLTASRFDDDEAVCIRKRKEVGRERDKETKSETMSP